MHVRANRQTGRVRGKTRLPDASGVRWERDGKIMHGDEAGKQVRPAVESLAGILKEANVSLFDIIWEPSLLGTCKCIAPSPGPLGIPCGTTSRRDAPRHAQPLTPDRLREVWRIAARQWAFRSRRGRW
jgi:hypothetical protein